MDNKICLIIQGPSDYVNILKQIYKNINITIIYSTWIGEEHKYNENDIVIFNKKPDEPGKQNIMLQQITTYNGLLKAKELGFKNAIKIREDCYFTNLLLFLNNNIDYNKLNFLYFLDYYRIDSYKNNRYKYLCDYIQIGTVDNLLKMWLFKYEYCNYPEELITKHVLNIFNKNNINFIGNYLNKESDIYLISRKLYLSTVDKRYYILKIT